MRGNELVEGGLKERCFNRVAMDTYRLTLGCRKYTRGSYQYCARAKP